MYGTVCEKKSARVLHGRSHNAGVSIEGVVMGYSCATEGA